MAAPSSDADGKDSSVRVATLTPTELPAGAPSEGLREETLVQLNADRLEKTVSWLCHQVQSLQNWRSDFAGQSGPAAAPDVRISVEQSGDLLPKLQSEQRRLAHDVELNKQKNLAQDELSKMRFDSIQTELDVRAKSTALDEFKKTMTSNMKSMEDQLRMSLTAKYSSRLDEFARKDQVLQDQVEKISNAVTTQIGLHGERLAETCDDLSERLRKLEAASKSDDMRAEFQALFEKLAGRLSQAEEKAESFGPLLESRLSDLRASVDGEIANICSRLTDTEKVANDAAAILANPPPDPNGLKALEYCKELFSRMEEVEAREVPPPGFFAEMLEWQGSVNSRLQSNEARMWRVESCQGQSPGAEARLPEPGPMLPPSQGSAQPGSAQGISTGGRIQIIEQIHCFKRDMTKSMDDIQLGMKDIKKFVGMQDPLTGQSHPDPLEWLDKRIKILADKTMKTERSQLLRRITEAEDKIQAFAPRFDILREELQDMVHSVKVPVQVDVELVEEVERLKSIIECLEACVPKETRRAMQFFRKAGGGGNRDSVPAEIEAQVLSIREEVAKALDIHRSDAERTQNNVSEALRGLQHEMEIQGSRLNDLGIVHPRCMAVLEILHTGLGMTEQNADCTGGTTDDTPKKPVMQQLEKAMKGIRFPDSWTPNTTIRSGEPSLHSTGNMEMWSTGGKAGTPSKSTWANGTRTPQQSQSCGRLPHLTR